MGCDFSLTINIFLKFQVTSQTLHHFLFRFASEPQTSLRQIQNSSQHGPSRD